jgi:hypothetical protein
MQMIVLGFASDAAGFEPGYRFALIDHTRGQMELDIDMKCIFLQSLQKLTLLNGKPVSDAALLAVVQALHMRVQHTFSQGTNQVSQAFSMPVSQEMLDSANVDIICWDPRWSMPRPGHPMWVIRKDVLEKHGRQVNMIQHTELNYLLDLAASTYDIESATCRPGSLKQKMIRDVVESEGFKLGRLHIAGHMRPGL